MTRVRQLLLVDLADVLQHTSAPNTECTSGEVTKSPPRLVTAGDVTPKVRPWPPWAAAG